MKKWAISKMGLSLKPSYSGLSGALPPKGYIFILTQGTHECDLIKIKGGGGAFADGIKDQAMR